MRTEVVSKVIIRNSSSVITVKYEASSKEVAGILTGIGKYVNGMCIF